VRPVRRSIDVLQRAYDSIIHDVAIQNCRDLLMDRAGMVGEDGQTHMGLYDIATSSRAAHDRGPREDAAN